MNTNPNPTARPFSFVLLAVVWAITAAIAFVLVKVVKIGPVIAVINEERGWGVHSGDFLFLIPVAVAVFLTVKWFRRK